MKTLLLTIFILYCHISVAKCHQYKVHTIKKGETISELLKKNGLTPLYGEKQWVGKILKMNRLTQASAKNLEKGDSIIIPFIEDSVSTTLSSTLKAKITKPTNHQYKFWLIYGMRDYTLSDKTKITVNQSFGAEIDYTYQRAHYSPMASLKIFNQNSSDFAGKYNANFTPSVTLQSGVTGQWNKIKFTPFIEYQFQSSVEFNNFLYSVRKDHLFWSGLTLRGDYNHFWAQGLASITVASIKNTTPVDTKNISATKLETELGYSISENYLVKMKLVHQINKGQTDTTLNTAELSFGIRL